MGCGWLSGAIRDGDGESGPEEPCPLESLEKPRQQYDGREPQLQERESRRQDLSCLLGKQPYQQFQFKK